MVRRVCRELGAKRGVIVLNDEAHHCYRRRVGDDAEALSGLTGDDRREAAKRDDDARVWISGLEAVARKLGVSDFSLIDAIEAGLVKIPRVPVDDDAAQPDDLPTYRNLWLRIRDDLPRKGRRTDAVDGSEPRLRAPLEGALHSLYANYAKAFDGRFAPEYAEVYGVPFSFIPASGSAADPKPGVVPTRVRALEDRLDCEIAFPRLAGYRWEIPDEHLLADFTDESRLALDSRHVPTRTEVAAIDATIGLLAMQQRADEAVEKIYQAIVRTGPGEKRLMAIMRSFDPIGSTRYVDFDTTKPTWVTAADRCHITHVVADSGWEDRLAERIEHMPAVRSYVKNQGLGFTIPYTIDGQQRSYVPDFIVCIDDGPGQLPRRPAQPRRRGVGRRPP